MLDDLKMIHERDIQDALGIAEKQWQQLGHEFASTSDFKSNDFENVVYCGIGGSALAARFVSIWPGTIKPFELIQGYDLPSYVDNTTLFIAVSYSGETEETLRGMERAKETGAQIAVITRGGKIAEMARANAYPLLLLPHVQQSRFATFSIFKALVLLLGQARVLERSIAELDHVALFLKDSAHSWLPTVPVKDNVAKQIALECIGKSVVIHSGPKLFPAAYKWKLAFNENAKQIAWVSQLPEFTHSEILGWTKQPVNKPYEVIDLRSKFEHTSIENSFSVADRLLSGLRPAPIIVEAQGNTLLEQLLIWVIL